MDLPKPYWRVEKHRREESSEEAEPYAERFREIFERKKEG